MRQARKSSGPSAGLQAVSLVFVLVLIGGLIYVSSLAKKNEEGAQAATQEEAPDPFADLEEELPAALRGIKAPQPDSDPFQELARLSDAEVWQTAIGLAKQGRALIQEAMEARDAGDTDVAREKGKEAQELLRKAVETTNDWEDEIGRAKGFDDPQVKAISKERTGWTRDIMALKKSAGL